MGTGYYTANFLDMEFDMSTATTTGNLDMIRIAFVQPTTERGTSDQQV